MDLSDLINRDRVLQFAKDYSKKQFLEKLSQVAAASSGLDASSIFETLLHRERLGSTGMGEGIAIPHGKIEGLDSLFAMFIRLANPIDFEAPDGVPADLVFLLLAPEGAGADHLGALSRIARVSREPALVSQIRKAANEKEIYSLLINGPTSNAA